jgi:hypothetical protein
MKKLRFLVACILCACCVYGQQSNCRISARDFVSLMGADSATMNRLLTPCYRLDRNLYNGIKYSYRRDMGEHGHSTFDFKASGNMSFSTTDDDTFEYYKAGLIKLGFKYVRDVQKQRQYEMNKYVMTPYSSVREDGKKVYIISAYRKPR